MPGILGEIDWKSVKMILFLGFLVYMYYRDRDKK